MFPFVAVRRLFFLVRSTLLSCFFSLDEIALVFGSVCLVWSNRRTLFLRKHRLQLLQHQHLVLIAGMKFDKKYHDGRNGTLLCRGFYLGHGLFETADSVIAGRGGLIEGVEISELSITAHRGCWCWC